MQQSELRKARQGLLARFAAGEIDKATCDRMLAELDQQVDDGEHAANRSFGDWPTEAPQPGAGRELSGFRLEAKIGRGGMGEVWKAYDPTAERPVVIKLVPPDVQHAAEEMARVKETFGRVHRLHHQHICPLYLLGEDPQYGYFLVMQYIDGQTLSAYRRSYVARCGSFPLEQVIRVLSPVAEALDYAHAQKVVHRDIKPQNILVVGHADDVQLVDFGLAAEVHTSLSRVSNVRMDTSGTRPYMAPEQWRGEYQDARTDQYALGVVAFELLAGRLPFDTPDFDILRACVLNDPPPRVPGQPEHVDQALARAMAKRREERFSSCRELIEALQRPPKPWPATRPRTGVSVVFVPDLENDTKTTAVHLSWNENHCAVRNYLCPGRQTAIDPATYRNTLEVLPFIVKETRFGRNRPRYTEEKAWREIIRRTNEEWELPGC